MAIASIWASMAAWFTHTVLFCAVNLIIATLFIASNNKNNRNHHHDHPNSLTRISRISSFLHRSTSINSSSQFTTTVESQHQNPPQPKTATYTSSSRLAQSIHSSAQHELSPSEPERQPLSQPANSPGQLVRAPSFLDRIKSFKIASAFDFGASSTQLETVDTDLGHNPELNVTRSKSEKKPSKKPSVEMKKSRSEMRIAGSDEEGVELRRPSTSRDRRSCDVDEEVDARADDFISRFKQQLKLQRLESFARYKEMLNRRSLN
ncbi:hypothetical protein R6Q57_028569 [Mikania cordata]